MNMDNETETQAAETPEPTKTERFKDDPAYRAMAKQIEDLRQADAARKQAEKDAIADAERKALERKQKFDEVKASYEEQLAELKATLAAKDREVADVQARGQLSSLLEGVNKYARKVFVSEYMAADPAERKTPEEYVAELREKDPDVFAPAKPQTPRSAGHTGAVASAANTDSIDARLKSGDPAVAGAAWREYLANLEAHKD